MGTYSGNPPCQARWQYTEIFRAKVIRVESPPPDATGAIRMGAARVRFEVLENFAGVESRTFEMDDPGSSCSYTFEAGKAYLVYAQGRRVTVCSPTGKIESVAEDLKCLRAIPTIPPRDGRVVGIVFHDESTQLERERTPFAGARSSSMDRACAGRRHRDAMAAMRFAYRPASIACTPKLTHGCTPRSCGPTRSS